MEPVDGSQQEFRTSIRITTPGQYQVDATSLHSGLNNPFSPQYAITPVVDGSPTARWSQSHSLSSLVSPLDEISCEAFATDDLPMDRVVQEFILNDEGMVQRPVRVEQPGEN